VALLDPDYDLVIGAYSSIWPRYERSGLGGLTRSERAVFLAWRFLCEVNNGGFRQFLSNPSGAHAEDTAAVLDETGMPHTAALLRRVLSTGGPPWSSLSDALDDLTDEFFRSAENPYLIIAQYVRDHIDAAPPSVVA